MTRIHVKVSGSFSLDDGLIEPRGASLRSRVAGTLTALLEAELGAESLGLNVELVDVVNKRSNAEPRLS